jgi:hypothetical protein
MISSQRVRKGTTTRVTASFVDESGVALTGLTPTLRVYDRATGDFLKDDGTWVSPAPSGEEYAMSETDASDLPGLYHFDFDVPDSVTGFDLRADGGASAGNRFQCGEILAVESDESELHLAFAMLANRRRHTVSTGVDEVMDNDGTTVLRTMTPTDGGSDVIEVVPS